MKYIDIGKVEIYLKGKCGGGGCDSCDCGVIMYEDAKVYTSGENYVIMTTDGGVVIETFEFNKVKTVKINQNGITSKTD
jgi:hypothetical protein